MAERVPPLQNASSRLPVEIWTIIFRLVGYPLAEDIEHNLVSLGIIRTGEATEPTRLALSIMRTSHRDLSSISLTCRTWSMLAIPLLYNALYFSDARDLTAFTPILRKYPLNDSLQGQRYGHAVRAIIIQDCVSASALKAICDVCPSLRFIGSASLIVKTGAHWRRLQQSLSKLSFLRRLFIEWDVLDDEDLSPASLESFTFSSLTSFVISSCISHSFGSWPAPNLQTIGVVYTHPRYERIMDTFVPFLRRNANSIRCLQLSTAPALSFDDFAPYGSSAILPMCSNLNSLTVCVPSLLPILWSDPYPLTHENLKELVLVPDPEDPDTTKRLRPLLQSLYLKNFPRLRFIALANSYPTPLTVEGLENITSLPTWLGQVFQKLEDEKIPVAQLPSKMLIGYELLTYFCDFVEDP